MNVRLQLMVDDSEFKEILKNKPDNVKLSIFISRLIDLGLVSAFKN